MVKSSWGNVVRRNGLLYGKSRKKYTRTHPYPEHIDRHEPWPREKAAIIIMKRKGNRIHHIADALGRSRDFVHRTLRNAYNVRALWKDDMRKLGNNQRLIQTRIRWNLLLRFMPAWEKWMAGEGDKPP
jgi:transposase